jgi:hypothetical protein
METSQEGRAVVEPPMRTRAAGGLQILAVPADGDPSRELLTEPLGRRRSDVQASYSLQWRREHAELVEITPQETRVVRRVDVMREPGWVYQLDRELRVVRFPRRLVSTPPRALS